MGADHTAGLIIDPGLPLEEFARASQEAQMANTICDSSGFCQFIRPCMDDIRAFYGAFEGIEVSREQIGDLAWDVLADEWKFNEVAGWKPEDDKLSDCLVNEGIGPDGVFKFDVGSDTIAAAKVRFEPRDELYEKRATG
jgi:aldehyde:ferredoxin oxidoreductase